MGVDGEDCVGALHTLAAHAVHESVGVHLVSVLGLYLPMRRGKNKIKRGLTFI